jgi:formylglycine-generating enzyme required for sulfatase activity
MLIQSSKTLPPPGFPQPSWDALGKQWSETREENIVLDIEGGSVTLGHNDRESEDRAFEDDSKTWRSHEFGWDNENPEYKVRVKSYQVDSLPISNGDYWNYMQQNDISAIPGSWQASEDVPKIKSLYGPVSMNVARHWPLMASGEELMRYAQWKGGRLPTEPELRLLWESETGPRPAGLSANAGVRRWHPVP